jgi:hypothetical protein
MSGLRALRSLRHEHLFCGSAWLLFVETLLHMFSRMDAVLYQRPEQDEHLLLPHNLRRIS